MGFVISPPAVADIGQTLILDQDICKNLSFNGELYQWSEPLFAVTAVMQLDAGLLPSFLPLPSSRE